MTNRAILAIFAAGLALFMASLSASAQPAGKAGGDKSQKQGTQQQWQGGCQGMHDGQHSGWYGTRRQYYGAFPEDGQFDNQAQDTRARVLVRVPPNARVWISDEATRQMGFERLFNSPPLEPGQNYSYTVRAKWQENGQEVSREKNVKVEAGKMSTADFLGQGEGQAAQSQLQRYGSGEGFQRGDRSQPDLRGKQIQGQGDSRQQDRRSRDEQQEPQGIQTQERTSRPILGKVVRVDNDQVIVSLDTGDQRTFKTSSDSQLFMEGQKTDMKSLKPGMSISITTKPDNPDMATRLEVNKAGSPDKEKP